MNVSFCGVRKGWYFVYIFQFFNRIDNWIYLPIFMRKLSTENTSRHPLPQRIQSGVLISIFQPQSLDNGHHGASAFFTRIAQHWLSVIMLAISFGAIGILCMISWIKFGELIQVSWNMKSKSDNRLYPLCINDSEPCDGLDVDSGLE